MPTGSTNVSEAFDVAFQHTVGFEGGYVNHRDDPGGETKYGISKRSYPDVDIAALTLEDAKEIYRRDFWDPFCAHLPERMGFAVFDAAVNSGPGRALRWLQRALDCPQTGELDQATVDAANGAIDGSEVLMRFYGYRLAHMANLTTWGSFGKGWARRVANLLQVN